MSARLKATRALQFDGHSGSIYTLEPGTADGRFFSGSGDRLVVEWDLINPQKNRAVANLPVKAFAIKYIPSRDLLLVGNFHGGIHIIELKSNKEIKLLHLHQRSIFQIIWDQDRNRFMALSGDGYVSIWDVESFELVEAVKLCHKKIRSLDTFPNSAQAAIGCGDGKIRIMDLDSLETLQELDGHLGGYSVNACRYSPDGKYLISGSRDAHINVWDIKAGYLQIARIPAHNFAIYSIEFSPSGEYFATGSMDKTIKIWSVSSLELELVINAEKQGGHTNSVNKLMWSAYKDLLVSTGDDRTIKAWKIDPVPSPEISL